MYILKGFILVVFTVYLLRVFHELFALADEFRDNAPLGLKLVQRLFLPLNQLFNVLNTAGSNVTGGAEHDSIQELNMGFQFITEGVTLPVEINLDLGLEDGGDEILVFLDQGFQFGILAGLFMTLEA